MSPILDELAELFRQRLDIDRQILDLIGEPNNPDADAEEIEPETTPTRQKAKRKRGKYSKGNPMPEEVKEEIHAKRAAGITNAELAREYGVSVSSIAKVLSTKPTKSTTRGKEAHDYVCVDGHEFKSKLPPGAAMCPVCHSTDCDLGTLNGPVVE